MASEAIDPIVSQYLQEQAPVFLLVFDRTGQILQANRYAAELTGGELETKTIREVFVDLATRLNLAELARDPAKVHRLNINTFTGLAQTLYFNFFDLGEQILALGKLDVAELETLRRELLHLNSELNLVTRELHQKNAELTRLNKLKNQFLGMAAHDLRKPVGIVLSYSEFLLDEAAAVLSKEQLSFLTTIYSSAEFMKYLIDDFLDIAVIEAGKLDLRLELTDLVLLVKQSLATTNHLLARKNQIELQLNHEADIPKLVVDRTKIEQAFHNIVSNAVEHSPPGGLVKIDMAWDGQRVTVSVQDKGPGIPLAEVDKLFNPFEKATIKPASPKKGTGLGLAIAYKIIQAHQGTIGVKSEVGEGSIFYFSLPYRAAPLKEDAL